MKPRKSSLREIKTRLVRLVLHEPALSEYEIWYSPRWSCFDDQYSPSGVRASNVLDWYRKDLEETLRFLTQELGLELSRKLPIQVYVLDVGEIRGCDPWPQILVEGTDEMISVALPGRTGHSNAGAGKAYMRHAMAHEATHAVCFRQPLIDGVPDNRLWIAEATAEWVAHHRMRECEPENDWSLRHALEWCDFPWIPVNSTTGCYSAFLLIEYLVRKTSPRQVLGVWRELSSAKDAWGALVRAAGDPGVFAAYCRDAYFLNDPERGFYCPAIHERFGPRACAGALSAGSGGWIEGSLLDFACAYYAIRPRGTSFDLEFETKSENLRMALAGCAAHRRVGDDIEISQGHNPIDVRRLGDVEYLVLVVNSEGEKAYPPSTRAHDFRFRVI